MGLVKLMSSENADLREHLISCRERRAPVSSFLSNKFIYSVLNRVCTHITNKIVSDIKLSGGRFGLCVDTTTDIANIHQTSIVVRYVSATNHNKIEEYTIGFTESEDGSGQATYNMVKSVLDDIGLDISNADGCSFDGASNMRSENAGFYHYIKCGNPECVYCWCYAHRFNLTVENSYKKSLKLQLLIASANDAATFLRGSSKRMLLWRKVATNVPNFNSKQRLKVIGQTRWGTKNSMLKNIISTDLHLFVLIRTFFEISILDDLGGDALAKVSQILTAWLQYDNCLSCYIFQKVFSQLNTTTKKLQEYGLNILSAINTIEKCDKYLSDLQENLQMLAEEADKIIHKVNFALETDSLIVSNGNYCKIKIPPRNEKNKIQKIIIEEVKVYIENVKELINFYFIDERNEPNINLYEEITYLDLPFFDKCIQLYYNGNDGDDGDIDLLSMKLSFKTLCTKIGVENENRSEERAIFEEMRLLNGEYRKSKQQKNCFSFFESPVAADDDLVMMIDFDDESGDDTVNTPTPLPILIQDTNDFDDAGEPVNYLRIEIDKMCYCIQCILIFLSVTANKVRFPRLYKLYIYVATLPVTQVKCERDFSSLKFIKTRLRTQLSQTNLRNLLTIYLCRDMFKNINFDELADEIAAHSKWAKQLLSIS